MKIESQAAAHKSMRTELPLRGERSASPAKSQPSVKDAFEPAPRGRAGSGPGGGRGTAAGASLERSKQVYINQFDAEKEVGGDGRNANCGPAALAMALKAQGLATPPIPGVRGNGTAGANVQAARYLMYKGVDPARDGVVTDKNGNVTGYAQMTGDGNENSKYTGMTAIIRGAEAAGATAEKIPASAAGIEKAIKDGKTVVVLGNFIDDKGKAKEGLWARGGGAEAHFITVTGTTSDGKFIVNDPANPNRRPEVVTAEQLNTFMNSSPAAAASIDAPTPHRR